MTILEGVPHLLVAFHTKQANLTLCQLGHFAFSLTKYSNPMNYYSVIILYLEQLIVH